jgi:hypothetical protein
MRGATMKRLAVLFAALLLSVPAFATTRDVGISGHTYTLVSAAQSAASTGDSIVVWGPGTWTQDWVTVNHNDLKIVCVDSHGYTFDNLLATRSEMPIFDGGGDSDPTAQQGIWRTTNSVARCEINGGEFRNTSNVTGPGKPSPPYHLCEQNGPNSVPFRIQSGCTGLFWLHNCSFHDNDMNYNGGPESLLVENCVMYHPNNSCGNQHDMYVQPAATSSTPGTGAWYVMIRYNQIYAPTTGNCIQTRAVTNYIMYNRIYDGSETNVNGNLYVNDGGLAYIIGNVFEQGAVAGVGFNSTLVGYCTDSAGNSGKITNGHHCWLYNNTFANKFVGGGIFIKNVADGSAVITYDNNIFYGDRSSLASGSGFVDGGHNYSETGQTNGAKFLAPGSGDYHLTAATSNTTIVDKGIVPGTNDGFSCTPTRQYTYDHGSATRTVSGSATDIGAFEFSQTGGGPVSDACTPAW